MECKTTNREVEPIDLAPNLYRCPDCGEFMTEDLVPIDPQPVTAGDLVDLLLQEV